MKKIIDLVNSGLPERKKIKYEEEVYENEGDKCIKLSISWKRANGYFAVMSTRGHTEDRKEEDQCNLLANFILTLMEIEGETQIMDNWTYVDTEFGEKYLKILKVGKSLVRVGCNQKDKYSSLMATMVDFLPGEKSTTPDKIRQTFEISKTDLLDESKWSRCRSIITWKDDLDEKESAKMNGRNSMNEQDPNTATATEVKSEDKILYFTNRVINSMADVDKLILDAERLLQETKDAKEHFSTGNYTISAKKEILPPNYIECIIPNF